MTIKIITHTDTLQFEGIDGQKYEIHLWHNPQGQVASIEVRQHLTDEKGRFSDVGVAEVKIGD